MDTLSIREIIEQVERGQIRIPAFQRGFVWDPDRVAFFMDTIFKRYPFGSLLFWRTKDRLKCERTLGPFTLPDPVVDFPIDYVLDGQQRITSLYAAFCPRAPDQSAEWKDIYFDYSLPFDAQDTQFFALLPEEVRRDRHFPIRCLFDTVAYRKATSTFSDDMLKRVDDMQTVFRETKLPLQTIRPPTKQTVAVIFERINRQGVPLDTLQLLSAWTWSEDFQLQREFDDLAMELEDYGVKSVDTDENLLLRVCAAILKYDPTPNVLVTIPGDTVRARFGEVKNGIKGALDFLQANLSVQSIANLPFQTMLVPLSVFYASAGSAEVQVTENQRRQLLRWFWRTAFSRRYSSGVLRSLTEDIEHTRELREGRPSRLGDFACSITNEFFATNIFSTSAVNTKTAILLLSQQGPLSLISGTPVDLASKLRDFNKTEFHHLMPRAYLQAKGGHYRSANCLANIAFITRAENRLLGGAAPSKYRLHMPKDCDHILAAALCPLSLFEDHYDTFVNERSSLMADKARVLAQLDSAS